MSEISDNFYLLPSWWPYWILQNIGAHFTW